jgi:hypothetical protein
MDTNSVIEARRKAEQAVADMPEGDLKLKAFELILNRLLSVAAETYDSAEPARPKPPLRSATADRSRQVGNHADAVPLSAPARVLQLKAEGFFVEQRGITEVRQELQTHGWRYPLTALSGTLMKLVRSRELRRERVGDGNKTVYKYFNP